MMEVRCLIMHQCLELQQVIYGLLTDHWTDVLNRII
jgi:hypothetical protein